MGMGRGQGVLLYDRHSAAETRSGGASGEASAWLARGAPAAPWLFREVSLAAQRRQLTVMFCDLVGSTELSARLDPEDLREVIAAYHRCCAVHIEQAGGFVAKYLGDGVLAYFGYPEAHEDDAERAVLAALTLTEAAPRIVTGHGGPLAVRVGVATGLVVVGDLIGSGAAEERAVVGETPNLAARLQGVAGMNRVVVSNQTRRLAAGLFEYRDLGPVPLKGLASNESVWEVTGTNAEADRFRARHELAPTPLIGREADLERVLDRWRVCATEGAQVVGVVGEPGIGKSRLVYEAHREIARTPHIWLEGGGAQVFRNTPFYPIAQMIRRRLSRHATLTPEQYLARLEEALVWAGLDGDALSLVAELIGVPTPDGCAPLTLGPDERRSALLSTLTEWILRCAARWPTAVVVEDLHWLDPSSLEFLEMLVERAGRSRLLVLYTARESTAPWRPAGSRSEIRLQRLEPESARRLVTAAAGGGLPTDVVDKVVARAEGVPWFAQELTRLMVERNGRGAGREIPSTLSDLLMAKLDELGSAKEIAQIASVLGSEFHFDLLQGVSGIAEPSLKAALARLVSADVIVARGASATITYAFRHSLVQDAAYEALLRRQRKELHRRAATVIAEHVPRTVTAQPEVLAQHWAGAGEPELALSAWQEAGRAASGRRAYNEAEQAYQEALAVLAGLPETERREERELELQSSLAGVMQITRGYSAPETMVATARARLLAEKRGNLVQQMNHAVGAWMAASSSGDFEGARRLADQVLQLAQADGGAEPLAAAYMVQMTSRYRLGDLLGAEEAFTAGSPYFVTPRFCRRAGAVAQTFGTGARNAWILGDAAEARLRMERGLALSRTSGNPYDLAFALYMAAIMAVLAGEPSGAEDLARQSIELSDAQGFPQFAAISRVALGRARAELGQAAEGAALIREGLEAMADTRSRNGQTMYLTWLAEALLLDDDCEAALAAVEEALSTNAQELFFRPESLRLRGEIKRRMGAPGAAADLREAMALAKSLGAKLFHQRAAASLAAAA